MSDTVHIRAHNKPGTYCGNKTKDAYKLINAQYVNPSQWGLCKTCRKIYMKHYNRVWMVARDLGVIGGIK